MNYFQRLDFHCGESGANVQRLVLHLIKRELRDEIVLV